MTKPLTPAQKLANQVAATKAKLQELKNEAKVVRAAAKAEKTESKAKAQAERTAAKVVRDASKAEKRAKIDAHKAEIAVRKEANTVAKAEREAAHVIREAARAEKAVVKLTKAEARVTALKMKEDARQAKANTVSTMRKAQQAPSKVTIIKPETEAV